MAPTSRIEESTPATTTTGRNRCLSAISVPRLHRRVKPTMRTVKRDGARHERRVVTEPRFHRQVFRAGVPRAGDGVVPVDNDGPQTLT
jgi:hypothetical protein